MPEILLIILCIVAVWIGIEFIQSRKPKKQLGPVGTGLEIHSGFNEDQIVLWNGRNGITVDKKDFREEFLHMEVTEIYKELWEKRRDKLAQADNFVEGIRQHQS